MIDKKKSPHFSTTVQGSIKSHNCQKERPCLLTECQIAQWSFVINRHFKKDWLDALEMGANYHLVVVN